MFSDTLQFPLHLYICSELYIHVCLDASFQESEKFVVRILLNSHIMKMMVCDASKFQIFISHFSFVSLFKSEKEGMQVLTSGKFETKN